MSVDSFHQSGTSPGNFARPAALVPPARPCRVAILGCGTVGSAVARRLTAVDPISTLELTHVFDRHADEKRGAFLGGGARIAGIVWTNRIDEVLASDADVIVEAIGGVEPAAEWIRGALVAGKSVVTANKQVIARDGQALLTLASRQGRQLRFEAAVGGGMPIVRAIGEGLVGDRITRIVAVLNGTTNAVLSRVDATGCTLASAVAVAQARGWAEADPSADLDGTDARAKLAILCALAFRLRVDPARIDTRSILQLGPGDFARTRRGGGALRQIAWAEHDAERSALTAWVAPALVPRGSIFARIEGPQNAALITGEYSGQHGIFGTGAGGAATAVAVLADLVAIARDRAAIVPPPTLSTPAVVTGLDSGGHLVDLTNPPNRPRSSPWQTRCPRAGLESRASIAEAV